MRWLPDMSSLSPPLERTGCNGLVLRLSYDYWGLGLISVKFKNLRFSDGTNVQIPPSGVVLLVGPNNAGKSQALRDLVGLTGPRDHESKAVVEIELDKTGTPEEMAQWIVDRMPTMTTNGAAFHSVPGWGQVQIRDILQQWSGPNLQYLGQLFIFHADATSRLTAGDSTASIDFSTTFGQHPIHKAYQDGQLEKDIDGISRDAFGLGISVDRYSGSVISLRVGEPPEFQLERGVPAPAYMQGLQAMPRLEDQGDGVRSYVGLLLHILGGSQHITLVDEPEAFLHPPQARRLGQVLAERTTDSQQVFMATHSSDVVQGALDSQAAVTIIRITRADGQNNASVLNAESVKELWSDPLLRYSNVLDGLFHDAVVLCESDSDCRFYSAVLDALFESGELRTPGARRPQVLFTHCGGKARLASVVGSLRAAGVPVVVVADFDILKNSGDVERILSALGADFSVMKGDLNVVASALNSEVRPVSKLALREELDRQLAEIDTSTVSKAQMESMRAVLRAESGWDKAKRSGIDAMPQGDPSARASALLEKLNEVGLLVVPVGELERFVPSVGGHGPSWVAEVLRRDMHMSPGQAAADFARTIERTVRRAI